MKYLILTKPQEAHEAALIALRELVPADLYDVVVPEPARVGTHTEGREHLLDIQRADVVLILGGQTAALDHMMGAAIALGKEVVSWGDSRLAPESPFFFDGHVWRLPEPPSIEGAYYVSSLLAFLSLKRYGIVDWALFRTIGARLVQDPMGLEYRLKQAEQGREHWIARHGEMDRAYAQLEEQVPGAEALESARRLRDFVAERFPGVGSGGLATDVAREMLDELLADGLEQRTRIGELTDGLTASIGREEHMADEANLAIEALEAYHDRVADDGGFITEQKAIANCVVIARRALGMPDPEPVAE